VRNKSFAVVRKEFSDVCPEEEVHGLVTTTLLDAKCLFVAKFSSRDETAEITD
jgi:hypothetical protein